MNIRFAMIIAVLAVATILQGWNCRESILAPPVDNKTTPNVDIGYGVLHPGTMGEFTNTSFNQRTMLGLSDNFTFLIYDSNLVDTAVGGIKVKTNIYVNSTPLTSAALESRIHDNQFYDALYAEDQMAMRGWHMSVSSEDLYFEDDSVSRRWKVPGFTNHKRFRVEDLEYGSRVTLLFGDTYEKIANNWQYIYVVCNIILPDSIRDRSHVVTLYFEVKNQGYNPENAEYIQFQASWDWLEDNILVAQRYRRYFGLTEGFGPMTSFSHYRDPTTFNKVGGEALLTIIYGYQGYSHYDEDGRLVLDLPSHTVISYDPSKIEILTEWEEPPPKFVTRFCGWLSDVYSPYVRSGDTNAPRAVSDIDSDNKSDIDNKFKRVALENYFHGKFVQIKRTGQKVDIHYRYLGGGEAYIFIWRNVPYEFGPYEGEVIGIRVTSENL